MTPASDLYCFRYFASSVPDEGFKKPRIPRNHPNTTCLSVQAIAQFQTQNHWPFYRSHLCLKLHFMFVWTMSMPGQKALSSSAGWMVAVDSTSSRSSLQNSRDQFCRTCLYKVFSHPPTCHHQDIHLCLCLIHSEGGASGTSVRPDN